MLDRSGLCAPAERANSVRAIACVVEGTGFKASITRSVLAGMRLLLRVPVAIKFFGTTQDAAIWLNPEVQPRATRELVGAIEQLRAQFEGTSSRQATNA